MLHAQAQRAHAGRGYYLRYATWHYSSNHNSSTRSHEICLLNLGPRFWLLIRGRVKHSLESQVAKQGAVRTHAYYPITEPLKSAEQAIRPPRVLLLLLQITTKRHGGARCSFLRKEGQSRRLGGSCGETLEKKKHMLYFSASSHHR